MSVSKTEFILVILGFLCIGIFLAIFAGGPIHSDEVSLMDAGLNNLKMTYSINRYTHIFLQKPFLELASTPIIGARIFWAFVLTLTGCLTYWCARLLSRENHIIHAVLAAVIYFSFHFFIDYSGSTIVDFTAMLMVMIFITVYIFAARNDFKRPWLIALGFIFFLSFKTKESTLTNSVLLFGLGFSEGTGFQFRTLWKNLSNFFVGLLSGFIFFIILNTIILGDPLFGFSPSSVKEFLDSYASLDLGTMKVYQGWYAGALTTVWLFPFILYLISGIKAQDRFTFPIRLLWLVPLTMVIFLTIMTFWRSYRIDLRFMFPVLPVICFLGAQVIPFEIPDTKSRRVRFGLFLFLTLLASIGVNYAVRPLADHMTLRFDDFLSLIFYPLVLSILIVVAFLVKRYSYKTVLIPVFCILTMTFYPIRTNIKYLAVLHQNVAFVEHRFYPFSAFADQLIFTPDMRFYVSSDLHEKWDMLSADKNEVANLYNIYFDSHARVTNFKLSKPTSLISEDLLKENFNYVLLTPGDWQQVTGSPAFSELDARYNDYEDASKQVILLVNK